ncbi:uncharacterized protein DEA37_0011389 [Paragonimus westermani]|uniref:G-protein coupled receptors family 1 profile domain-containing protein n=1 Tax=Paragonimus westermani TaxID=34504 RepID=A0A5J4N6Y4_9TREM|nr:uncharacterized protein DEA37_0011389 [Paragonimus westermani]
MMVCSFVYLLIMEILLCAPLPFHRSYENNTCLWRLAILVPVIHNLGRIHAVIFIILGYAWPTLFTGIAHILVVWRVMNSITTSNPLASSHGDNQSENSASRSHVLRIMWTTVAFTVSCIILNLPHTIIYAAQLLTTHAYVAGSLIHQGCLLFITVGYCLHPCILLIMCQRLRQNAMGIFKAVGTAWDSLCRRVHKKRFQGSTGQHIQPKVDPELD